MRLAFALALLNAASLLGTARFANADEFRGFGASPSAAVGVSASGAVVIGYIGDSTAGQAFVWAPGLGSIGLGTLGGGSSQASDVSAFGRVVVGSSEDQVGQTEAFRWTPNGGMIGLSFLSGFLPGGNFSYSSGVSADGSVVAGTSSRDNGVFPNFDEAFRWTQRTGMVGLGFISGDDYSEAIGVSANGNVVFGQSGCSGCVEGNEAFRWTERSGMVGLGYLGGLVAYSVANAASADGSVIVGQSYSGNPAAEAFRWTQGSGMVGLGFLPGYSASNATLVSSDGRVVAGYVTDDFDSPQQAFRWTQRTGMVGLGFLSGASFSEPAGMSADGSVIVGTSGTSFPNTQAFRWTERQGMRSVADLLNGGGVTLPNWTLTEADGVSANGQVIVGTGLHNGIQEAWWASIPLAGHWVGFLSAGALDNSLRLVSLTAQQALTDVRFDLGNGLASAHAFGGGASGEELPAGSFRHWGSLLDLDSEAVGRSLGAVYQASDSVRLGIDAERNDLRPASVDDNPSGHLSAFIGYEPQRRGLRVFGSMMVERLDRPMSRPYLNGGELATSGGNRQGLASGAAVTAGWAVTVTRAISVTPFVGYEALRLNLDAYTETSGAFAAEFDAIHGDARTTRVGSEIEAVLGHSLEVSASASWAHNMDAYLSPMSGRLLVVSSPFAAPRSDLQPNFAEVALGATWRPASRAQMHLALRASDSANAADVSARLAADFRF